MSGVKMEKPASMIEWLHPVAQFPNLSILTQNNIHTVWITKSKFLKHSMNIILKKFKVRRRNLLHFKVFGMINLQYEIRICQKLTARNQIHMTLLVVQTVKENDFR